MRKSVYSYLSPKLYDQHKPEIGGMGVYSTFAIQKGELLALWGGQIIHADEVDPNMPNFRSVLQVEEGLYLFVPETEAADLFNHSCNPNAGFNGQIALVAMRDIEPGEEVCFDYAMCDGSNYDEFDCYCGSENCRDRVKGTDWARPELWEKYNGYFMPYLARRIESLKSKIPMAG